MALCCKPKEDTGNRVVALNDPERNKLFPNNEISNTKYNFLTFIPLNLWEQFR